MAGQTENQKIKNSPNQVRLPFFLGLAVALGVLLGATLFQPSSNNPQGTARGYLKFREILSYIDREYVDTVNTEELSEYAINKMLEKLDPHSSYIPAKDLALAKSYLESDFDGIGVEFNIFRDTLYVIAPIHDGPSEQVGIQAGDKIIKVNGENMAGVKLTNEMVFKKLRGPRNSKVNLTVLRRNESKPLQFSVTRKKIPSVSVDAGYMVDDHTGYIKVSRFSNGTYDEFKNKLSALRKQGLQRLILDLRDNPGGYLDHATRMADEFLAGNKKLVYTDGKGTKYDADYYARQKGDFESGELIVLINEGSASASEILAGALQDHDRALIVGRRSFGKGLVQVPISLSDGSELRLTISRYYTPSGRSIQKPYDPDSSNQYENDILNRYKHGEFFSQDSIKFDENLKYKTAKGRTVYGGGGIMPDVFVPQDTLDNTELLTELYRSNLLREYAMNYSRDHKKQLDNMSLAEFKANFKITDAMFQGLLSEAKRSGIKVKEADLKRSEKTIRNNLKAFIARNRYQAEGFYPVLNENDPDFQRALGLFGQARQLSLGK
ncbi:MULTISPECIES: S41 family peptidase [Rufibacter]|uniref:Carboxyl-terminal processing protease n=1 Tax=Rufibacter quisquiliarum TaxID=1549639 RepID=A0A839GWG1_9BACT|nr:MULTISPECIES: S41 family peptidase [Rufibacter]MBA9079785.1 carboxyl-terminal processing protease [Rufibacter quisquiliarum]